MCVRKFPGLMWEPKPLSWSQQVEPIDGANGDKTCGWWSHVHPILVVKLQCPNLPTIGCTQSVLIRDSVIHPGLIHGTEDALPSAWDQLLLALSFTRSEEACSEEQ